ncbi:hypothetical protein BST15_17785 [Mycolicibacter arupensis]|jgi:NAD-dependent deacetylase|uniref:NAD-dependent deacetylase n=2 Tax=Mycolicibacter arupensis TaxID=342002 RepID=A0ABX3RI60_9MYCO|nr:hypothetical protein BST15_17785 [Mycolicibacter arupensis]
MHEQDSADGLDRPSGRAIVPLDVCDVADAARRVTVFTGAGMSADSGLPTFRDAQAGLWSKHDTDELYIVAIMG